MKKHALIGLFAATMLLTVGVSLSFAQDGAAVEAEKPVEATVTGVNYCLRKTFAKDEMAAANPDYVAMNALRVTQAADAEGKESPELAGQTLHYLPTEAAEPVLMGESYQGSEVQVTGRVYMKANVLRVEEIEGEAAADDESWDIVGVGGKSGVQIIGDEDDETR